MKKAFTNLVDPSNFLLALSYNVILTETGARYASVSKNFKQSGKGYGSTTSDRHCLPQIVNDRNFLLNSLDKVQE